MGLGIFSVINRSKHEMPILRRQALSKSSWLSCPTHGMLFSPSYFCKAFFKKNLCKYFWAWDLGCKWFFYCFCHPSLSFQDEVPSGKNSSPLSLPVHSQCLARSCCLLVVSTRCLSTAPALLWPKSRLRCHCPDRRQDLTELSASAGATAPFK